MRTRVPPPPALTCASRTPRWNVDAFALEDRLHLARDLGVLARDQAVAVLDAP